MTTSYLPHNCYHILTMSTDVKPMAQLPACNCNYREFLWGVICKRIHLIFNSMCRLTHFNMHNIFIVSLSVYNRRRDINSILLLRYFWRCMIRYKPQKLTLISSKHLQYICGQGSYTKCLTLHSYYTQGRIQGGSWGQLNPP